MKKLRSYQTEGVAYLRKNKGGALFEEMRLGKTLQVIRYVKQLGEVRVLVLAPYAPLEGWKKELAEDGIKNVNLWYGSTKERWGKIEVSQKQPGWFLFNKEAPLFIPLERYMWDVIILDESTFIANPQAKITKWALAMANRVKIKIILTGTPAPESPLQYFCQLRFVNPNIIPYKSYWEFRAQCFRPGYAGYDWRMEIKAKAKLALALNKHCFIRSRKDVGLFKEKIYEQRMVELSPATRKLYRQAEHDWIQPDTVLKFAGQRWDIMRQLCGRTEKQTALLDLLETELKGKRVIVWAWYVQEVLEISQLLKCEYICGMVPIKKREEIRERFLSNDKILVAQPETWKFGTNLSGVDAVIFFSSPCGLLTRSQVEERTVDLSTGGETLIIDFVCKDTVDEDILESLSFKESEVKALERIRKNVLSRNS